MEEFILYVGHLPLENGCLTLLSRCDVARNYFPATIAVSHASIRFPIIALAMRSKLFSANPDLCGFAEVAFCAEKWVYRFFCGTETEQHEYASFALFPEIDSDSFYDLLSDFLGDTVALVGCDDSYSFIDRK